MSFPACSMAAAQLCRMTCGVMLRRPMAGALRAAIATYFRRMWAAPSRVSSPPRALRKMRSPGRASRTVGSCRSASVVSRHSGQRRSLLPLLVYDPYLNRRFGIAALLAQVVGELP